MVEPRLTCVIPSCNKPKVSKGVEWCSAHYARRRRHGDTFASIPLMQPGRKCSVADCNRSHECKGFCEMHYQRWKKYGDQNGHYSTQRETFQFYRNVVLTWTSDECLEWPFGLTKSGSYGILYYNGKSRRVNRLVCEEQYGPPPTSKHQAAHSCGNSKCVNRWHLRWATPKENIADRTIHGTDNRGERSGHAKLTTDDVIQIRKLRGQLSQRAIAKRYGIQQGQVGRIQRKVRWSWLD